MRSLEIGVPRAFLMDDIPNKEFLAIISSENGDFIRKLGVVI